MRLECELEGLRRSYSYYHVTITFNSPQFTEVKPFAQRSTELDQFAQLVQKLVVI